MTHPHARTASAAVLLAALALGACNPAPAEPVAIALTPCRLASPGLPQRVPAECGWFDVPSDRTTGQGTIALHVAVVRAVSRKAAGDAVFLLAGGPGQAATEAYAIMASALAPLARQRDIVLVDQRGTGRSSPLDCPDDEPRTAAGVNAAAVAQAVATCRAGLSVDPAPYTTREAVADLDAVRAALGYEAVDLVGISYGTRVAQSYARAHPSRTRAMILDGVVPQDLALGADMAAASQRALDAVLARCAGDAGCRQAFGDARETLRVLGVRAAAGEVVELAEPTSAERVTVTLSADVVDVVTRFMLYAPETAALLPLLYDLAGRKDEPEPLAAQFLTLTEDLSRTISHGMAYSVLCSEDVPFYDAEAVAASNRGTYLGDMVTAGLAAACEVWPVPPAPAAFKAPLACDAPTLLLSGAIDPVTPPAYGERVLAGLARGRHLVAPGQGHGVLARGCMPRLAATFLDDLQPADLDAACLGDLRPAPFFLRLAGPTP